MTDVVADAYASMAQFRTFVRNSQVTDATDPDTGLELLALEAAARAIDRACNRDFRVTAASPSARYFTPIVVPSVDPTAYVSSAYPYTWARHYALPIDDVADTSGMVVRFDSTGDGAYTNTITGYRVGPANAPGRGRPYNRIVFNGGVYPPPYPEAVEVTVKWGWSAIPTTITNANLLQASRFLKRRDAPFGVAGSPDMGSEIRLLAKLDPDVAIMVGAFKSNWGAV